MDDAEEVWVIVLKPRRDSIPAAVRVRRLLKWADSLGLRCVRVRDAQGGEDGKQSELIQALAERVAVQSELLSQRAEKPHG